MELSIILIVIITILFFIFYLIKEYTRFPRSVIVTKDDHDDYLEFTKLIQDYFKLSDQLPSDQIINNDNSITNIDNDNSITNIDNDNYNENDNEIKNNHAMDVDDVTNSDKNIL